MLLLICSAQRATPNAYDSVLIGDPDALVRVSDTLLRINHGRLLRLEIWRWRRLNQRLHRVDMIFFAHAALFSATT
jgi:hypothetical protein